jgi:hypothetical protein
MNGSADQHRSSGGGENDATVTKPVKFRHSVAEDCAHWGLGSSDPECSGHSVSGAQQQGLRDGRVSVTKAGGTVLAPRQLLSRTTVAHDRSSCA